MRRLIDSWTSLKWLMLLAVLALPGCADTAVLCDGRLTPINVPGVPTAAPKTTPP